MNYFAHGYRFVDDPYFLAGTALPDWLNVVDRRVRVRRKGAISFVDDADPQVRSLARGVVRHHDDDDWFHRTAAFTDLSWHMTVLVRDALPEDEGFRPSFLGHILIEILLDAELIAEKPTELEAYYSAVDELDEAAVERAVNRMATRTTDRLAKLLPLFSRERFLCDYADDEKLCYRLNQVMKRVRLPALGDDFAAVLPEARRRVRLRQRDLLNPGEKVHH